MEHHASHSHTQASSQLIHNLRLYTTTMPKLLGKLRPERVGVQLCIISASEQPPHILPLPLTTSLASVPGPALQNNPRVIDCSLGLQG
jgi:hypothetical protein